LPSEKLIKNHERFWRRQLPESFIDFIKVNNGVEVERFLCILEDIENHPKGVYDIDVVFSQIGERLTDNEELIGADVLPIASIFEGDFLCLDFRTDQDNPSVCIWSHEESGELKPVTCIMADSFSEFLNTIE